MFCGETLWVMAGFVFFKAGSKIAGDAYVKRSVFLGAQDVNVTIAHEAMLAIWSSASSAVMTKG